MNQAITLTGKCIRLDALRHDHVDGLIAAATEPGSRYGGASFEGIRRLHMPAPDGTIRDTAYYSILATEWPTLKQHLHGLLLRGSKRGDDRRK